MARYGWLLTCNEAPRIYNTWGMDSYGDTLAGHTFIVCSHPFQSTFPFIMSDLYFAAAAGDLERVKLLVERGVGKDKTSLYSRTPLYAASQHGHLTVVRYLIEQGADMEKTDTSKWTPLIVATFHNRLEVVHYLLEQGANRDKADNNGHTALHYAAFYGHLEIAMLLMVYGADLDARNRYGNLPIDMTVNTEIKQAIRDEPERRRDQQPRKRCIEEDRHTNAAAAASTQQEGRDDEKQSSKQPADGEVGVGKVADEDQDSELSSEEEDNWGLIAKQQTKSKWLVVSITSSLDIAYCW